MKRTFCLFATVIITASSEMEMYFFLTEFSGTCITNFPITCPLYRRLCLQNKCDRRPLSSLYVDSKPTLTLRSSSGSPEVRGHPNETLNEALLYKRMPRDARVLGLNCRTVNFMLREKARFGEWHAAARAAIERKAVVVVGSLFLSPITPSCASGKRRL